MNEMQLSQRLMTVANYVEKNSRLADIGSDHAYLPVHLALKKQIDFAVAGEVAEGPLLSAKKQVAKNQLEQIIDVRLGDGLAVVNPAEDQITAMTIAGMGGSLITAILERGREEAKLTGNERLILQPNVGELGLRKWLVANQYQIIAEEILEEDNQIYEVLVAEKAQSSVTYTEKELTFGPILLKNKNQAFTKKWQHELSQRENVLTQLESAQTDQQAREAEITRQIQMIQEVLK